MTEAISAQAGALLIHYSFDISRDTVEELLGEWLAIYPAYWLRLAVVEALYQGRYKTVSVEQILVLWQRRGQPLYHFNLSIILITSLKAWFVVVILWIQPLK